ncbi:hypothetical protein DFA_05014 [Cavenderia fasciculata]|uniref:Uncharacterized protein n=1 Tax=Cavenderia fasciculata TaxID=261658 RepID=F4PMZ1_CACFS|nr:uncharacterized protein DFA_05014 [Cavenderia fasciculata]EGG22884.1 hypothetical protein DFA_05014 [Cavenderia fasciculata]|eukprot:XP_004360735.1 hypothetical protein DFA_05014 [Cavenderia fasciculata]
MEFSTFSLCLPMIIKFFVNILEKPLPQEEDDDPSLNQNKKRIIPTLETLFNILSTEDGNVLRALAPFVHLLVDPLCKLAIYPLHNCIRSESLSCLPYCLELSQLHSGASQDKKTMKMFSKILNVSLSDSYTDLGVISSLISVVNSVISMMGDDAMTLDQVQMTLNTIVKMEKWLFYMAYQILDFNEDVIGDQDPRLMIAAIVDSMSCLYSSMADMIKYNSTITAPLITAGILENLCKMINGTAMTRVKVAMMDFITDYCYYGGEFALNSLPLFIPTLIKHLKQSRDYTRIKSAMVLAAAKVAKERLSPWLTQLVQGMDTMISQTSFPDLNKVETDEIIYSTGQIILLVPPTDSSRILNTIIPKWLNNLPRSIIVDDAFEEDYRDHISKTFCSVVKTHTNKCLGQQYQHVVQLYQIITGFMEICAPPEIELLTETWSLIKDTYLESWDQVPSLTRNVLSKLK